MHTLLELAREDEKHAKRYIELAEKIGMKARESMPKELKLTYCKTCKTPYSSKTVRIRINNKKLTYHCLLCDTTKRIPLTPKKE